jgi:hypothetical protein
MRWCVVLVATGLFGCGSGSGGGEGGSSGAGGTAGSAGSGGSGGSAGSTLATGDRVGTFSVPHAVMLLDANDSGASYRRYQIASDRSAFSYAAGFAADLDGDGFDSVSFLDTRSGTFHLERDGAAARLESVEELLPFAPPSDDARHWPIAGDVDEDGRDDVGTYDTQTGELRIQRSSDGSELVQSFSAVPSLPLMGDWNGDGVDSFGRYQPLSGQFELSDDNSTLGAGFSLDVAPSDTLLPVAGDFDGDGRDSVGVYDAATQRFHLTNGAGSAPIEIVVELAPSSTTWLPVVGRWKPAPAAEPELGFDWPTSSPGAQGVDAGALDAALSAADANASIYSVLLVRHGKLVAERYFHGAERSFASNVKSVSKSMLSALFAIAAEDGQLSATTELVDYFPGLPAEKQAITLAHLVTMTAGLHWEENDSLFVRGSLPRTGVAFRSSSRSMPRPARRSCTARA